MEAAKGVTKEVHVPRGQAGDGSVRKTIKIPAGVDSGSRVRFDDFDIVVDVVPDKQFKREGDDIIVEKDLVALGVSGELFAVEASRMLVARVAATNTSASKSKSPRTSRVVSVNSSKNLRRLTERM